MSTRLLRVLTVLVTGLAGVAAPAHAEDDHRPAANCAPPVQSDSTYVVFIAGEAHATVGHVPLVSLTLECTYRGPDDTYGQSETAAAPVVTITAFPSLIFDGVAGLFDTVCQTAEAVYADGHVATTPETCRPISEPSVDAGPVPAVETAPVLRCEHTRGPSPTHTWMVEVTGVAGLRSDVPITTAVQCTVLASDSAEITAQATELGAAAVASRSAPALVEPLLSKCASMTVQYLTSGTATSEYCEFFP